MKIQRQNTKQCGFATTVRAKNYPSVSWRHGDRYRIEDVATFSDDADIVGL